MADGIKPNTEVRMTDQELIEKLMYLRDGAVVYRDLAKGVTSDHDRRILARGVLVVLDSFLKLAPQLKNRMPNSTQPERERRAVVELLIQQIQRDYDARQGGYFDTVRDGFGGHRLPLSLGEAVALWVDIDESVGAVLVEAMESVCQAMSGFGKNPPLNSLLAEIGLAIPRMNCQDCRTGVVVSADDLGMTRRQTVALVPNPTQIRFSRIVSLKDFITSEEKWAASLGGVEQVRERVLSLWLLDAFSFLGNFYDDKDANDLTILADLRAGGNKAAAAAEVKRGMDMRDSSLEAAMRKVRNHWAAHLDSNMTLEQIRAEVSTSQWTEFSEYVNKHIGVFESMCSVDMTLNVFLLHNRPLRGIDSVCHQPRGFDL